VPTLSVTFLPKISKSIHVHQSYSKPKVGRFFRRHGVDVVDADDCPSSDGEVVCFVDRFAGLMCRC